MKSFFLRYIYLFVAVGCIFLSFFFLMYKIDQYHASAQFFKTQNISTQKEQKSLSIFFAGDTMLDRNVRLLMEKSEEVPFQNITSFTESFDLAVLNLEGVFTDNTSLSVKNREILRFTFDPKKIDGLVKAGVDIVSQANNHTNDFGRDGLLTSRMYLKRAGIFPLGDYFNESKEYFIDEKNRVAIIAFNQFAFQNTDITLKNILEAKEKNLFVIVFAHWGDEYQRHPNEKQKNLAYEWIDAGVDIVIGAHPHVIQIIEEYKGKPIIYSLGNFVFDQYFSQDTQEGIGLGLFIFKKKVSFQIFPIAIRRSVPELLTGTQKQLILDSLADESSINNDWKQLIKRGEKVSFNFD